MNRAIRHFLIPLAAMGVAACATVRVFPEAHAADASHARTSPSDGQGIVVRAGDTLYGIASRQGVTTRELADWNGLAAPYTLHVGERLRVSPPSRTTGCTADAAASSPMATPPSPTTPLAYAWRWPADGVVVAKQAAADALTPGIDIVGPAGSPVRAAADGVVLYSGTGSPGYEELVVLRHAGGWVSSYAHNRRRLVADGEQVRAGAIIAEMGRAGATRDMLHFELRRDGALVDPLRQLPRR